MLFKRPKQQNSFSEGEKIISFLSFLDSWFCYLLLIAKVRIIVTGSPHFLLPPPGYYQFLTVELFHIFAIELFHGLLM